MGKNEPLPHDTLRLCEALFDIAQTASAMTRDGKIEAEDSRELFRTCLALAQQFETEHSGIGDEYMLAIEDFAARRLTERYGRGS